MWQFRWIRQPTLTDLSSNIPGSFLFSLLYSACCTHNMRICWSGMFIALYPFNYFKNNEDLMEEPLLHFLPENSNSREINQILIPIQVVLKNVKKSVNKKTLSKWWSTPNRALFKRSDGSVVVSRNKIRRSLTFYQDKACRRNSVFTRSIWLLVSG